MNPDLLLQAIILGLELAIRIHDDMPADQRAQFWVEHQKRIDWIERAIDRLLAVPHGPAAAS